MLTPHEKGVERVEDGGSFGIDLLAGLEEVDGYFPIV